jgi:hypothetical protein
LSAQQRMVFESGFIGLTLTFPVWVGRLLFNVAFINLPLADALRIGEKKTRSIASLRYFFVNNRYISQKNACNILNGYAKCKRYRATIQELP